MDMVGIDEESNEEESELGIEDMRGQDKGIDAPEFFEIRQERLRNLRFTNLQEIMSAYGYFQVL